MFSAFSKVLQCLCLALFASSSTATVITYEQTKQGEFFPFVFDASDYQPQQSIVFEIFTRGDFDQDSEVYTLIFPDGENNGKSNLDWSFELGAHKNDYQDHHNQEFLRYSSLLRPQPGAQPCILYLCEFTYALTLAPQLVEQMLFDFNGSPKLGLIVEFNGSVWADANEDVNSYLNLKPSVSVSLNFIPEPSTAVLMLFVTCSLGLMRRRKSV